MPRRTVPARLPCHVARRSPAVRQDDIGPRDRSGQTERVLRSGGPRDAVAAGDVATAQTQLRTAVSIIQRTCVKGVIHRNQANRRISRLNKAVKAIATR